MLRTHHTNNDIIDLKKMDYVQNLNFKPRGIWYDVDNSWLEWCDGNTDWAYNNHFRLDIDESKMLIIDTEEKLLAFDKKYSMNIETLSIQYIDWQSVSRKYSGIEISPYQYSQRLELLWYYGFDVASGCIWNLDCVKSIKKISEIELLKMIK